MGILKNPVSVCAGDVLGKTHTLRAELQRVSLDFSCEEQPSTLGSQNWDCLCRGGAREPVSWPDDKARHYCPPQVQVIKALMTSKEPTHPEEQRVLQVPGTESRGLV